MRWKRPAARLALLLVAGTLLGLPATGLADDPETLRARGAELDAAEQQARVDLFALESKLRRAESALAEVESRLATLERERASSRRQLAVARRTLAIAERRLAEQVRALYTSDQPDTIAVFLGAATLEDAIEGVDSLHRAADATSGVLDEAQAARIKVAALLRRQTARRAELQVVRAAAAARTVELAGAQAERLSYIAELQAEQVLNQRQIAEAVAAAEAAHAAATVATAVAETAPSVASIGAQSIVAAPPPPPEPEPQPQPQPQPSPQAPVVETGKTLTVVATAYTTRGTTATGIPTGPGIVAVDPSVIPLGTRMTIPGYGEGVAADTGAAIAGLRIDLWVATAAEAAQWQWQTVTITLH